MAEHMHEWRLKAYLYAGIPMFKCKIKDCNAVLPVKEAERRLNAAERLIEYATHKPGCYESGDECICGLDDILEGK